MDKIDGHWQSSIFNYTITNLCPSSKTERGQIKISADNFTTAESSDADSMAGMEEG